MMQEIPGKPIHDLSESKIIELSKDIGKLVGLLHKNGVMHGDLTTSNFILFKKTIFVIDFGLSQNSIKPEDQRNSQQCTRKNNEICLEELPNWLQVYSWKSILCKNYKTCFRYRKPW